MSKFFGKAGARIKRMSDTNLLLVITIAVFFIMYIMAVLIVKGAFLKPQQFLNNLGNEAALIIASCGMSIVMIGGGIDIFAVRFSVQSASFAIRWLLLRNL